MHCFCSFLLLSHLSPSSSSSSSSSSSLIFLPPPLPLPLTLPLPPLPPPPLTLPSSPFPQEQEAKIDELKTSLDNVEEALVQKQQEVNAAAMSCHVTVMTSYPDHLSISPFLLLISLLLSLSSPPFSSSSLLFSLFSFLPPPLPSPLLQEQESLILQKKV